MRRLIMQLPLRAVLSARHVRVVGRSTVSHPSVSASDIEAEDAIAAMMFDDSSSAVAAIPDPLSVMRLHAQKAAAGEEPAAMGVDTVVRGEIPPERHVSDPVPPMDVFDAKKHHEWLRSLVAGEIQTAETVAEGEGSLSLAALYAKNGPQALWQSFAVGGGAEPPKWFRAMCADLHFRRSTDGGQAPLPEDVAASESEPIIQSASEQTDGAVDPFLWLEMALLDEHQYVVGPYVFPATNTYSAEHKAKLCNGNPRKQYIKFAETLRFPDRVQLPTTVGTVPAALYVDPSSPVPTVFLQLSKDFPPAMWLPVKPTATAIRRVLAEFAWAAAAHRDAHNDFFEAQIKLAKKHLAAQRMLQEPPDVLRYIAWNARNITYAESPANEYANFQELFLGEFDDPEKFLEHFDNCPFVFSTPLMRPVVDVNSPELAPRVDGPGVATLLYRCVFSKALLLVKVHLAAEVKLPPQDPEAFKFLWKDSQVAPKSRIPVFVRVCWPDNSKMCAGGTVARRFNLLFGTEFAHDMPVDAIAAVHYVMNWANELPNLLGVYGMRRRVAELEAAAKLPQPPLLYPGSAELPNPEYTIDERLGMHVQYLAALGDPDVRETIERLRQSSTAPVRMGCAKAAMEIGDRNLFRFIVSNEPPGRNQHFMSKLVRRRKKRDLVDPVPRLLDDQYELAGPLWTKKGTRIDPNTVEGALDVGRVQ